MVGMLVTTGKFERDEGWREICTGQRYLGDNSATTYRLVNVTSDTELLRGYKTTTWDVGTCKNAP
jgi:hypothetical protein